LKKSIRGELKRGYAPLFCVFHLPLERVHPEGFSLKGIQGDGAATMGKEAELL
jgi:hypothetical protein